MLINTFCHIPRIGLRNEMKIWEEGIRSWDHLDDLEGMVPFGKKTRDLSEHIERSRDALADFDGEYFTASLPSSESWRLFPEFRSRVAYLDIETSGPNVDYGAVITSVAIYDGQDVHTYVHGDNLRHLEDDIYDYDLLVTYNGKCFDIPFIERYFRIRLPHAHIDLRFVLQSLGLMGGLKGVERQLGLDRGELDGVDGYFAVLLWNEYRRSGDQKALETLIAYNIEDTVNLEKLMVIAYNMKLEETPFGASHILPMPETTPVIPFEADIDTIDRLRRKYRLWR